MNAKTGNILHPKYVQQNAIKMKLFSLLFLLFIPALKFQLNAQTIFVHHNIANNDTVTRDFTRSNTLRTVIFFCPTAKVDMQFYQKKAAELERKLRLMQVSELTVHMVYFIQDTKNNSKGLKYASSDTKDTLYIGQFECIFVGFDEILLNRSKSKMKFNFDLIKPFEKENLFSVPIVDTNKCFDKMQDRIPFYADFITESINPNYTQDEKMQFLRDSITVLYNVISEMRLEIDSMKIKTQENFDKNRSNNRDSGNEPTKNSPADKPKKQKPLRK
jgi:hypothetical protein